MTKRTHKGGCTLLHLAHVAAAASAGAAVAASDVAAAGSTTAAAAAANGSRGGACGVGGMTHGYRGRFHVLGKHVLPLRR